MGDITAPERLELHDLAEEFGLPATVVEDCLDPGHLPKVECLGEATSVIVRVRDRAAADDAGSIQELTRKAWGVRPKAHDLRQPRLSGSFRSTGATGFDGLVEGIAACPGPRSWLILSEQTQLPTLIWRWLRKLSFQ